MSIISMILLILAVIHKINFTTVDIGISAKNESKIHRVFTNNWFMRSITTIISYSYVWARKKAVCVCVVRLKLHHHYDYNISWIEFFALLMSQHRMRALPIFRCTLSLLCCSVCVGGGIVSSFAYYKTTKANFSYDW